MCIEMTITTLQLPQANPGQSILDKDAINMSLQGVTNISLKTVALPYILLLICSEVVQHGTNGGYELYQVCQLHQNVYIY